MKRASYPQRVDGTADAPQTRAERREQATADTRASILAAARACLLRDGFANLSTRNVADEAGVPLSQIHYHFGSKQQLVLAMLEAENARLLQRQRAMFGGPEPLWQQWDRACDFLDEDLRSGYVRVLQEMVAAGWSDAEVAALMALPFLGAEATILLGVPDSILPSRSALRKIGLVIRTLEEGRT